MYQIGFTISIAKPQQKTLILTFSLLNFAKCLTFVAKNDKIGKNIEVKNMKEIEKIVISRVKNAIVPHHQTGARNTMDCRSSCGISFSLGGEAVYTQNGEAFVSDANTVIFHPEGASYDMRCTKGGEFALINFHTQNPSFERFIAVRISDMALLKSKFAELQEAAMLGESAPRVMRIMYEIVELINEESREGENTVLSFAVGVIKERYMEQSFNIALLAATVHVSESYLRRLFSSVYGISPKKYLMGVRISRAKNLLSEGRGSVGTIAAECGFVSVYNFCRAFKEAVGTTPSEYRHTHRYRAQM